MDQKNYNHENKRVKVFTKKIKRNIEKVFLPTKNPVMKEIVNTNQMIVEMQKKKFGLWIDKLTFFHIFILWVVAVVSFGFVYFWAQNDVSFLYYSAKEMMVNNIEDAVYFSFVAATTTGFGDIVPFGNFKLLAICEVVFGLMLLALVTSKLVSLKQDVILGEVYELSLKEKVTRLRSSLLLFRQNLDRLMNKLEEKRLKERDVQNLFVYSSSLEDALMEAFTSIVKSEEQLFVKNINPVNAELILNSIVHSWEKLGELLRALNRQKVHWSKSQENINSLQRCLELDDHLFSGLDGSSGLRLETRKDLKQRNEEVIKMVRGELRE